MTDWHPEVVCKNIAIQEITLEWADFFQVSLPLKKVRLIQYAPFSLKLLFQGWYLHIFKMPVSDSVIF